MTAPEPGGAGAEELGWVFVPRSAVPRRWQDRAVEMAMIPLLPDETRQLLSGEPVTSAREEDALIELLAAGRPTHEIARSLQLSARSVERRIARLRRRFGTASKQDLVRLLAGRGFGTGVAQEDAG